MTAGRKRREVQRPRQCGLVKGACAQREDWEWLSSQGMALGSESQTQSLGKEAHVLNLGQHTPLLQPVLAPRPTPAPDVASTPSSPSQMQQWLPHSACNLSGSFV